MRSNPRPLECDSYQGQPRKFLLYVDFCCLPCQHAYRSRRSTPPVRANVVDPLVRPPEGFALVGHVVIWTDGMEKRTLRFSFIVSVVFCLLCLWTVAQGKQIPLSLNGAEKLFQQGMKAKEEAEQQESARKRAEKEEQRRSAMEEKEPGRQEAQAEADQKTGGETEGQPREEEQSGKDGMVSIPGGEFLMGCNEQVDSECEDNEKPQRQINLPAFKIDKTEVTVEAYRKCVDAKHCTLPKTGGRGSCNWDMSEREKHPINCIDWNQAAAFCAWVGKRLPTDAEWEKAARGTDGRVYPSGNAWDITKANVYESYDGYKDTAPVGSFPAGASPYGALDMAGNVWEWTADWERNGETRSLRGGSWVDLPRRARTSRRIGTLPISRLDDVGFRCAQ